jgi:hypothetical protein
MNPISVLAPVAISMVNRLLPMSEPYSWAFVGLYPMANISPTSVPIGVTTWVSTLTLSKSAEAFPDE